MAPKSIISHYAKNRLIVRSPPSKSPQSMSALLKRGLVDFAAGHRAHCAPDTVRSMSSAMKCAELSHINICTPPGCRLRAALCDFVRAASPPTCRGTAPPGSCRCNFPRQGSELLGVLRVISMWQPGFSHQMRARRSQTPPTSEGVWIISIIAKRVARAVGDLRKALRRTPRETAPFGTDLAVPGNRRRRRPVRQSFPAWDVDTP